MRDEEDDDFAPEEPQGLDVPASASENVPLAATEQSDSSSVPPADQQKSKPRKAATPASH